MTIRKIGLTAALIAIAVAALPALAGASGGTAAKVSIQAQQGGFFGYVHSSKQSCESGRRVVLFKQKGDTQRRGVDTKIGTDIAQPNGPDSMWSINTKRRGDFYAYVSKTSNCKAAYSRTISN